MSESKNQVEQLQVIYSANESAVHDGAGFWSNKHGWVQYGQATVFTPEEAAAFNLPASTGGDAKWGNWLDANASYGGDPEFIRSEQVRAEYLESGCQVQDLEQAIKALLSDCPSLFADETMATTFLMEQSAAAGEQDQAKTTVKVAVFCRNASGEPDILIEEIQAGQEDMHEGRHYDMAILVAEEGGYEAFGAADICDPAWPKLAVSQDKHMHALQALLLGLRDLGFGSDAEIDGADAVQAISDLYADVTGRILANDKQGAGEATQDSDMLVSLDGGKTYHPASYGVRIVYKNVLIDGEDGRGEVHVNATGEGLITDVWTTRDEPLDHNIGTDSLAIEDIVRRLVGANQ